MQWFVQRWQVEVTLADVRAHLGAETQRQGSDKAIVRTTPLLLALFSRVSVMAHGLSQHHGLPVRRSAWYGKPQPTFSDALALVRRRLWAEQVFDTSRSGSDTQKIPDPILQRLTEVLCYAA